MNITKNKIKLVAFSALSLFCLSVFASGTKVAASKPSEKQMPDGPYLQVIASGGWAKIGKTQDWAMDEVVRNRYVDNSDTEFGYDIGIGGGYGFSLSNIAVLQVGAGVYHVDNYESNGYVQEDLNPALQNLSYKYDINSNRAMAELRLIFAPMYSLMPYISAGAGCAWNDARDYKETAIDPNSLPGYPFANKTTSQFSYQLGAGIIYKPFTNFAFFAGYNYLNLGKAELGSVAFQTNQDRVSTDNIGINQIQIGLTYFFN